VSGGGQAELRVRANLWRGREAVGGHLVVAGGKLLFRAHALNNHTQPLAVWLSQVAVVRPYRTYSLVPNGLEITTVSGSVYRFVVSRRKQVMAAIEAHRF
jgi:hypothetical protein